MVEPGARWPGHERAVAGGLAQAQQELERLEHAPARLELGDDLLLRRGAHRVVHRALLGSTARSASTTSVRGGSSARDLALQPPQHERARCARAGAPAAPGSPAAIGRA